MEWYGFSPKDAKKVWMDGIEEICIECEAKMEKLRRKGWKVMEEKRLKKGKKIMTEINKKLRNK